MGYHMATFTSLSSHITLANDFLLCSTLDFERFVPFKCSKSQPSRPFLIRRIAIILAIDSATQSN